jgi:hypothetical protein
MYNMVFEITIGIYKLYKLSALERVSIERSQSLMSKSCRITVPGMIRGMSLDIEEKIKRGDEVTVKLGYDGVLKTEFTGYLKAIYQGSPMVIECEDSIYQTRRPIQSKVLKNVTVKEILEYVLSEINPKIKTPFVLKTDVSGYKWDRFVIYDTTGYEVLDRLKKESGLMIYANGNEIHCHLAYTEKTGQCTYDFNKNIREASKELKYVKAIDKKVLVKIEGRTPKGGTLEVEAGEKGGSVVTLDRPTINDRETLENIAKEELKRLSFDGYSGSIKGWLLPFCDVGFSAKIVDKDYPEREGIYYVTGTQVVFSKDGGVRTINLGVKLSK